MRSTNLAPYLNHSKKRLMLAIAYIDFVFKASANYLITITLVFKGCSVFFFSVTIQKIHSNKCKNTSINNAFSFVNQKEHSYTCTEIDYIKLCLIFMLCS